MPTNQQHDSHSLPDPPLAASATAGRSAHTPGDALPAIWNIRESQNSDFVGREAQLLQIERGLCEHGIAVLNEDSPPVGGVGKSELAREYAYRHADDYQVVWWVHAEESAVLQFGYAQLLTALNLLAGVPDEPRHSVEAARDYLSHHSGWLLILDGIESPEALESFLPAEGAGHVIVTTLLGEASLPHESIAVGPLARDESLLYFQKCLPGIDAGQVETITDQLGRSPLILHLISRYVRGARISVRDALATLRSKTPIPLRSNVTKEVYKGVLRIIVAMTLERLRRDDASARDLATVCAFLGPIDIPIFLLNQEIDGLSKRLSATVRDEAALDVCLETLEVFGLIERHDTSISMHEIVQAAIREQLSQESHKAWANAAVRLVTNAFPFKQNYRTPIPACNRLLAHSLAATEYAEEADVARESSALLLYHLGLYMHGRSALDEAKTCYLLSIAIGQKVYGVTHPTFATRINSLGIVEHELGNLKEARECFEKSFEICEALFGPLHEAVYTVDDDAMLTMPIRNLCTILEELGDVEAAQSTYERAMKIYLEVYGWNHPMVAECANRFGRTWHRLGRPAKARNCFEKAVLSEESSADADSENLALYLNNLGSVLLELNEAALAHERLEHALRLDRQAFENGHPAIGRDLVNLGSANRLLRRFDDAERCYREALEIIEATDKQNAPQLASLLNHLGVVLLDLGKAAEARTYLERALALNTERYGESSPETIRNLINLGRALDRLDAHSNAMDHFTRALSIVEAENGKENEHQATIVYRIGRSHHADGEFEKALQYLQRAMKIDTNVFGEQHPAVARDAFAIGNVLADMNDNIVAMGHFTLALDIYEIALGKNSPKARKVRSRLDELSR